MRQLMSSGRPGSISSLMLFKAVWSPNPQVAATGTRWPWPGRYGSRDRDPMAWMIFPAWRADRASDGLVLT
jgi:hypothetical protein